ncbi:hypothetical protein, partial [Rhizobium paranaense]
SGLSFLYFFTILPPALGVVAAPPPPPPGNRRSFLRHPATVQNVPYLSGRAIPPARAAQNKSVQICGMKQDVSQSRPHSILFCHSAAILLANNRRCRFSIESATAESSTRDAMLRWRRWIRLFRTVDSYPGKCRNGEHHVAAAMDLP